MITLNKMLCVIILILLTMDCTVNSRIICEGHIYDTNNNLKESRLTPACNLVKQALQDRSHLILLRYQKNVNIIGSIDNSCDLDNEAFRKQHCDKFCANSIVISVFYEYRKIRVTTGSNATTILDFNVKNNIIKALGGELVKGYYEDGFNLAVKIAVEAIEDYYYKYPSKNTNINHRESNSCFFPTFVLIVILLIICCIIGYCITPVEKEEVYIETNIPINQYESDQQRQESEIIHNHVNSLLNYIKDEIKHNTPPITSIDKCTICLTELNPYWKQEEAIAFSNHYTSIVTTSICNLERFSCGHFYHKDCLIKKGLNECIMCTGPVNRIQIYPSYRYFNTITEENIQNAIKNLEKIYDQETMKLYAHHYKQDVVIIRETFPTYVHTPIIWIGDPFYMPPVYNTVVCNNYYDSGVGGEYNNGYGNTGNNWNTGNNENTGNNNWRNNNTYESTTTGGDYGCGGGNGDGDGDY